MNSKLSEFLIDIFFKAWYNTYGSNAQRIPRSAVAFSILFEEVEIIFLPSLKIRGGDIVDYVTWSDVIQIALLVFAIISCFSNKKKITASRPNKAVIFINRIWGSDRTVSSVIIITTFTWFVNRKY